jgi:hypothetical protein
MKEAVVSFKELLTQHFPGEAEENYGKPHARAVRIRAEILTRDRPNTKQECCFLWRLTFCMVEWQIGLQSRASLPIGVLRFHSRSSASLSRFHVLSLHSKRSSCCLREDGFGSISWIGTRGTWYEFHFIFPFSMKYYWEKHVLSLADSIKCLLFSSLY